MTLRHVARRALLLVPALGLWSSRAAAADAPPGAAESVLTPREPPRAADAPVRADTESGLSIASRIVAEAMMGTGVATVGYLVGPRLLGAGCRSCRDAAGWVGATAMFPLGVYWGGHVLGGRGRLLHVAPASLVVSGASVIALTRAEDEGSTDPPLDSVKWAAIASAPLSIVLYELSHRFVTSRFPAHAGLGSLRLSVRPEADGWSFGGDLRF